MHLSCKANFHCKSEMLYWLIYILEKCSAWDVNISGQHNRVVVGLNKNGVLIHFGELIENYMPKSIILYIPIVSLKKNQNIRKMQNVPSLLRNLLPHYVIHYAVKRCGRSVVLFVMHSQVRYISFITWSSSPAIAWIKNNDNVAQFILWIQIRCSLN